jgi:cyclase
MKLIRIIPSLLVKSGFLVKGEQFKNHNYIGDIYNAVKIFSEKGAHEIILLDIESRSNKKFIDLNLIKKIKNEIFVPLTVGGGIDDIDQVSALIHEGVEKVCLNSVLKDNRKILSKISNKFGSQSVVACVDVKKDGNDYSVWFDNGKNKSNYYLKEYLKSLENEGAGEVILTSIDNEGLRNGFDIKLYKQFDNLLTIPIIAQGGAGQISDFIKLFDETAICAAIGGASFVYYGSRKAVLINYPNKEKLDELMRNYET